MQYIEKFSSLYTTVKNAKPMTMAVDGNPNKMETDPQANGTAGGLGTRHHEPSPVRKKRVKAPNISQNRKETSLTKKQRLNNWSSKDSNTKMALAGSGKATKNKRQEQVEVGNKKERQAKKAP